MGIMLVLVKIATGAQKQAEPLFNNEWQRMLLLYRLKGPLSMILRTPGRPKAPTSTQLRCGTSLLK